VTSGAAAVLWSLYPRFTAAQIKLILQKTSSHVAAITDEIKEGDGRLDLEAALAFAKELGASGDPATATPSTLHDTAVTPTTPLPTGASGDPDAKSSDAVASGPNDKGDGSANGCAVVGLTGENATAGTAWAGALLAIGLLLPLGAARRRPLIKER
jgi:hypothetical protein